MKKSLTRLPAPQFTVPQLSAPQPTHEPFTLRTRIISTITLLGLVAGLGLFASRPARTVGGPVAVSVANVPLPTTEADNPAKQPVEVSQEFETASTSHTFYIVPSGKRLVIEYINILDNTPSDPASYTVTFLDNGIYPAFNVVPNRAPFAAASQKVLLYFDAGQTVQASIESSGSGPTDVIVNITGHLVNVP